MIDALDLWLPSPLDQRLVDAERGVARGLAAKTLPIDAEVRGIVLGEALYLTRRASTGVVRYLRALTTRDQALPTALFRALERLVGGYEEMLAEVDDASDRQLAAVLHAWEPVERLGESSAAAADEGSPRRAPRRSPRSRPTSMIDPRQVRARVLALSADPGAAEITLTDARLAGRPAVLVRVPAYRRALSQPVVQRLWVRLLDGRSEVPCGQSLLTVEAKPPRGSPTVHLESIVALPDADVASLRVDVYDLLSTVPPAVADTDETLQEARRATVFLDEWRRLLAVAQVSGTAPVKRLHELAERLARSGPFDQAVFAGGPSPAELHTLADGGETAVDDSFEASTEDLFAIASGPGRLLAAELAAAERRGPHSTF